ncbi:unnamed protein product [marine sediment metagenome]|uniref:Uncharacterized protein n=1 Tax=marine sediment metagenome TaxID=412755 RepID=X1J2W7_9ZZZZ
MAIRGHHFFKITKEVLKADEFSTMLNRALQSFQVRVSEIVEIGKKQLAAEMEIHVLRHMKSLQKKYHRLSSGLQQCLKDTFTEFEINCEAVISQLRLSYV